LHLAGQAALRRTGLLPGALPPFWPGGQGW